MVRRAVPGNAGGEVHGRAIPVRAPVGCEDGPVHAGEALAEEPRLTGDDEVGGLVPRHEALSVASPFILEAAKAHEGVHLVGVPAHGLLEAREGGDVRVEGVVEQRPLSVHEAVEQPIEQAPDLGRPMAGHGLRPREEGPRDAQVPARRLGEGRRLGCAEEIPTGLLVPKQVHPLDLLGGDARGGERSGVGTPTRQGAIQENTDHQT